LVPNLQDIVQISCGCYHSLALDLEGSVYSFGNNEAGQLGLGDNDNRNIPQIIPSLQNIKQISCGGFHSFAIDSEGRIYTFGNNENGQLGLGDQRNRNIPQPIPNLQNILQISCGIAHTLALDLEGRVFAFGYNEHGQLGIGDKVDRSSPQPFEKFVCGCHLVAITKNHQVIHKECKVLIDLDEGEYEGIIIDKKREIFGIMRYKNGVVFEGEWKNDRQHGRGIFSEKNLTFEGRWENGEKNGFFIPKKW